MSKQTLILAFLLLAANNVNVYAGTSLRRRLPVVARDWSSGNGDEEVIRAHHRIDRLTIDKMEAKALEAEDDSEWTDVWYSRVMVFTSMPDPGDETTAPTPSLTATLPPTPADGTTSAPTMPTTPVPTPVPSPTTEPSESPSAEPTTTRSPVVPSASPSESPTVAPSASPSVSLTQSPSASPTQAPSSSPSASPTAADEPTAFPTGFPTEFPTASTPAPSKSPTSRPSSSPTTSQPTGTPTFFPTGPTFFPTSFPTNAPSPVPSKSPTGIPSVSPTDVPSFSPTFSATLSYNAVAGTCAGNTNGLGCAGPTSGGNPNDLVNCFTASDFGVTTPYVLDSVRFWIGATPEVPADLAIKIWTDVVGGAPGATPALTESITGYVFGENEFDLTTPMTITTDEICVGLYSGDTSSGFRLRNEDVGGSNSFILAPTCDIDTMTSNSDLGFEVAFCLEALVHGN